MRMKIKCINNYGCEYFLTIGKTYDVIKETMMSYVIIDDRNERWYYPMEYFKPLSEIRNDKIERLLDE